MGIWKVVGEVLQVGFGNVAGRAQKVDFFRVAGGVFQMGIWQAEFCRWDF